MKETVYRVFDLITTLVISLMIWGVTIGTLSGGNTNGTDYETGADGNTAIYVGTRTVYKEGFYKAVNGIATTSFYIFSDSNGNGYSRRSDVVWDSGNATAEIVDEGGLV